MKILGVTFLIYAVLLVVIVLAIIKYFKYEMADLEYKYQKAIRDNYKENQKIKQELEEAKDNETIAIRKMNNIAECIKEEYNKKFNDYKKEFYKKISDIENIFQAYGNPVLVITKIKSIIKELSATDQSVR